MSQALWRKMGFGLLLLAGIGTLYLVIAPLVRPLPVYMALPELTLTDQDGQAFDFNQTRGRVVALSPVYTHCPDVCPITTAKMRQIQERIQEAGYGDQVQLVTFTVDPQRDTPEVLKRFASFFEADSGNWVFLSGTPAQIQIVVDDLDIFVERVYDVDGNLVPESSFSSPPADKNYLVNHTDRIFLADRQGNVRAYLPGSRSNVDDAVRLIEKLVQK